MASKTCTKCKVEKNLSSFYKNQKSKDGYAYVCTECVKAYYRNRRKSGIKPEPHIGERLAIEWLQRFGIFADSGKNTGFKWVDVVAWGCVKIEVKFATNIKNGWHFSFYSTKNKATEMPDFFIFVMESKLKEIEIVLLPESHQLFFDDNNTRKTALRISHQHAFLSQHKNNWHLIETMRLDKSRQLKALSVNRDIAA